MKNELQPFVDKVNVSKKSIKGPGLVISPISSSTRQMEFFKRMMEEKDKVIFYFNLGWNPKKQLKELNL
jgi:hypothetical protein